VDTLQALRPYRRGWSDSTNQHHRPSCWTSLRLLLAQSVQACPSTFFLLFLINKCLH